MVIALRFKSGLVVLALAISYISPGWGQTGQQTPAPGQEQPGMASGGAPVPDQPLPGRIGGKVVDQTGAVVAGARVRLTRDDPSHTANPTPTNHVWKNRHPKDQPGGQELISGDDGQFFFAQVAPGPFQLTITSTGFGAQTFSGTLHSGETVTVPAIGLDVAEAVTEVRVALTRSEEAEVAEAEIKVEEKQRVLGAIPNFYVSYIPDAVPLNSKQKFKLAWKTVVDPFTFVVVGGAAGVEQAQNHFAGYGQGIEGYGKRFGAGYADTVAGTFIGSAVLPSLLKQDPRYFYKGTGGAPSRFLYAIANSVICKGDNGRWQVNYSNIMGSLAAGGISNIYYPAQDRDGAGLTFENGAIGIGSTAIANLFQEFVIRKLTPKIPNRNASKP